MMEESKQGAPAMDVDDGSLLSSSITAGASNGSDSKSAARNSKKRKSEISRLESALNDEATELTSAKRVVRKVDKYEDVASAEKARKAAAKEKVETNGHQSPSPSPVVANTSTSSKKKPASKGKSALTTATATAIPATVATAHPTPSIAPKSKKKPNTTDANADATEGSPSPLPLNSSPTPQPGPTGEYDPMTVLQSFNAEWQRDKEEGEKKRQKVREHRNRPIQIPRDAKSKDLYAQLYRLHQERSRFIAMRHEKFYLDTIVNQYPTPRFPYIDQRNVHLWIPQEETRRRIQTRLTEVKKKVQEETIQKVLLQVEQSKEEGTRRTSQGVAASSSASSVMNKKRGRGTRHLPNASPTKEKDAAPKFQRMTGNSLSDSLALETALLMSEAAVEGDEKTPSPTPQTHQTGDAQTTPAAPGAPATSSSALPAALASLSFARTTPLLRVGNFILFDNNPEQDDNKIWEPARILSINRSRTRMRIESVSEEQQKPPPLGQDGEIPALSADKKRRVEKPIVEDDEEEEPEELMDPADQTYALPPRRRWVDLESVRFFEYVDVIWAKVKGFDWWPAELCEEVDCNQLVPPERNQVNIAFCGEAMTIQSVGSNSILPYYEYCEVNAAPAKLKKKSLQDSYRAAEEAWQGHMWQSVLEESERRSREALFLREHLSDVPTFFLGKRVSVFWPLDEAWYSGVVKQYNLHTKKLCIVYDDDAVEWLDIQKEKMAFTPSALAVYLEGELPSNPAHVKQTYKTFLHQSYELRDSHNNVTAVGRDFLPDYVPRSVEQVDSIINTTTDPADAKLVARTKLRPETCSQLNLASLNCWECGLDLEKWHGPGLLSTKYGGSSNPARGENKVEVISCGRCTKVVHSFCLKLMLKRKDQTAHALPANSDGSSADAADAVEIADTDKVLPPHLSCSIVNPRCPDCLKCEHCNLISNKNASVHDLVTCDVCGMRVHLQCNDPAFDPAKHTRPTEGWVCTLCVQCRCCGASHSRGGKSKLPPLPPPSDARNLYLTKGDIEAEEAAKARDGTSNQSSPVPIATDASTNDSAAIVPAESIDTMDETVDGAPTTSADDPATASASPDASATPAVDGVIPSATPTDASAPVKRKKKKPKSIVAQPRPKAPANPKDIDMLPFSQRYITKWVDTDEELERLEEEQLGLPPRKKYSFDDTHHPVRKQFFSEEGVDKSFWLWTNAFTVCQPCGFRLEKRKYCPICVVIYDSHTTDPMVQCDSCNRWVHISCDPNASANTAKLDKDNTQYHCSECIRRERSNEMTSVLDDLVANDKAKAFLHPVSEEIAPDYQLTIKTPMDFTTIYKRLSELQYSSLDQFKYDLNLIWRNAKDYNPVNSGIHRSAIRLQNRSMELFSALAAKHQKDGLFDQTIGRIADEEEEKKQAEVEREQRELELKRQKEFKRLFEPQFPKQPRLEYYSFFLSLDDIRIAEIDTCLLCGSVGDDADLIFCVDCGECAHTWCLSSALQTDIGASGILNVDVDNFHALTVEQKQNFRCPNCISCSRCGGQERKVKSKDPEASLEKVLDQFVPCSQCKLLTHVTCVPYLNGRLPRNPSKFKCPGCISCRCCKVNYKNPHEQWSRDFTLCQACNKLYQAGNVCQVCDQVYRPRDENTPMMCCDLCSRWIHMECDGLTFDQYHALTQDASKKYYCPQCVDGLTPAALVEKSEKDAAKRLASEKRRLEKNKANLHIGFFPEPLPDFTRMSDLHAFTNKQIDRIQAHRRRLLAQQRHQATVSLNQAVDALRRENLPIPPMEEPNNSVRRFEQQAALAFHIMDAVVRANPNAAASSNTFAYNLALVRPPSTSPQMQHEDMEGYSAGNAMHIEELAKQEPPEPELPEEPEVPMDESAGGAPETNKVEVAEVPAEGTAAAAMDIDAAETAAESVPAVATAVKVEQVEAPASMDTTGDAQVAATAVPAVVAVEQPASAIAATETKLEPETGASAATPAVAPASASAPADASTTVPTNLMLLESDQPLTTDQALEFLDSEAAHSARKDDWRICFFCHKRGDQEFPKGEGRLLPALTVSSRWIHVQCALWSDRVTTNAKGQLQMVAQLNRINANEICNICSLPGATLKCKRGTHACPKYHFSCALARNCCFTVEKELCCELHSHSSRSRAKEAMIDKITRRMTVYNPSWNRFDLFAMRMRDVKPKDKEIPKEVDRDDFEEQLSKDEIARQQAQLSEYYSDYENQGDIEWKRRKLTFLGRTALKEEIEAARRARHGRDEDDDSSFHPLLPFDEREVRLKEKQQKNLTALFEGASNDAEENAADSEEETPAASSAAANANAATKEDVEDSTAQAMEVDDVDREESKNVEGAEGSAARPSSSRKRFSTRRHNAKKPEHAPRNKELERLVHALPPVFPSSTEIFFRVGALSVTNLGELVPESPMFHDMEYLYPLGYTATRLYWSYQRPGERASYVCEILAMQVTDATMPVEQQTTASESLFTTAENHPAPHQLVPVFRITISDDAAHPIVARSAPAAWKQLMDHFPSFLARNVNRARMRSGDTFSWSLGGSAFFGLSITQVMQQIELMQRADECSKYRFKLIERLKAAQAEREANAVKTDAANAAAAASPTVDPVAAVSAPSTALTTTAASSSSAPTEYFPPEGSRAHGLDRKLKFPAPAPVAKRTRTEAAATEPAFSSITIVAEEAGARRRKQAITMNDKFKPSKEIPLPHQYKIMKASAPRARVAHSVIHEWGLFANQDLEEGAMVIEYLGELIRPRISDLREKYYEDNGLDSCYMFRIDDDYIVDSTKRGNISRFINHSCDPNCHTECIDCGGFKKIVVLANRFIAKDEEVTYDYFFASENEKIRCNCGAINCAGRLN